MVDRGTLEPQQGEHYRLTFDLEGRKAVVDIGASSVINPFRRDALEQFRCPALP
jgi:type VI secretion system protein ImpL